VNDDHWDEAHDLLRLYGSDALIMAALKADGAMERANLDEARKWQEVIKRMTVLPERPHGPLH
jgi:hypothetical protein